MLGFGIRVSKQGKKIFQVRKKKDGKAIRVKIGEYLPGNSKGGFNLKAAKDLALKVLADIEKGINPNEEKRTEEKAGVSLNQALADYLVSRGDKIKPRTKEDYQRIIHIYTHDWAELSIANITRDQVINRHKQTYGGER